jgi:hypothetical protein
MAAEKESLELYQPMQAEVAIQRPPAKVLEEAGQAAKALQHVIDNKRKPVKFNGETYLEFEDWQTVGRFYGITAKVRDTKFVQYDKVSGFEASADALLVSSGQIISSADAMCLNDERNWSGKPMFQLRSMAQTRACAKSLRNVLAWVVVLAGYKPTPAEEMDGVFQSDSKPKPQSIQDTQKHNQHEPEPAGFGDFPPAEDSHDSKPSGIISDKQRKRLYAIAKNSGFSDEQFKALISACGYKSSTEVQSKHYQNICECIEGNPIEDFEQTIDYLSKWCKEN